MRKVVEVFGAPSPAIGEQLKMGSGATVNKVSWCRYIPENSSEKISVDHIPSHLLAVTTGSVVSYTIAFIIMS